MLSKEKYRNSNFTRIEINLNNIEALQSKNKMALNIISEKNIKCAILLCFEYIHKLHMLSLVKYRNSIFKRIEKILTIVYAHQC